MNGGARSRHTPARQSSHEDKTNNNSQQPPAVAPRTLPRSATASGGATKAAADSNSAAAVQLKQSSWASRDNCAHDDSVESGIDFRKASNITIGHVTVSTGAASASATASATTTTAATDSSAEDDKSFLKARDLWERRTSFQSPPTRRASNAKAEQEPAADNSGKKGKAVSTCFSL